MKRPGGLRRVPFPAPGDGPARWSSLAPGGLLGRHHGLAGGGGFRPAALALVAGDAAPVLVPSPGRRRDTGFPASVKDAVRTRAGDGDPDGARCEACGRWLGRHGGEIQHRAARSAGGCADQVINGPANAVLLCGHGAAPVRDGCHGACEDRDPAMGMGRGGFWLRHGTTPGYDPRNVPVRPLTAGRPGVPRWLDETGGYAYQAPGGGA